MIKVIAHGRLTRDAEMKTGEQNGTEICKFSVACDWYMGEKKVTFLSCIMFGKRAASLGPYLKRGGAVVVEGPLEIREYDGKYYTTLIVNDIEFGAKPKTESSGQGVMDYVSDNNTKEDTIPF